MKTKSLISYILFLLVFTGNLWAQKPDFAKLDTLMQNLENSDKFMGSIAVSDNGQIIYSRAIGYEEIETLRKSTPESKFRIGSISKMFTATLVFKAIEEKRLTLDQTIDLYFPDIKNANKITIGNLLNHRSGIHSFTEDSDYLKWNTKPISEKELLAKIEQGKSEFEPDSKSQYSNSNYVLLTIILEKIYKKPYKELIKNKITKPLELKRTYYGGKINLENHECFSYSYNGKWAKEAETDMSVPLGAGAVVSNPEDLTKFIEVLFAGKLISESSLKQMTMIKDGYGMGIFQYPFYNKRLYGHTGGIDGFASFLAILPEDNVSVAVTSNGTNFSLNTIMVCALSCYYNKPFEVPSFKTITLRTEDLDKYLGEYSSKQLPIKITFTKKGNKLIAQGSGQPPFDLEATDKDVFRSADGRIVIEFKPADGQMILKQGGGTFTFSNNSHL